jgi:CBS domain-containing protein
MFNTGDGPKAASQGRRTMTIASILRTKGDEVVTAPPSTPIHELVEMLHARRIGAVVIADGGAVAGIVSERDVVRCLHEKGGAILSATAADIMTSPVQTISPDEPVLAALALITQRRIRHLPVVDSGRLIGLVSIGDLVKRRIDDAEAEAAALKDYIRLS